jgi:hypothetical protein
MWTGKSQRCVGREPTQRTAAWIGHPQKMLIRADGFASERGVPFNFVQGRLVRKPTLHRKERDVRMGHPTPLLARDDICW